MYFYPVVEFDTEIIRSRIFSSFQLEKIEEWYLHIWEII
ncbi:hypothetical protein RINTHM_610 [Richelia intracellularis HM01]|nr:hypothetical protein RINTHM_610 [Richelia intracellularis HM01]